jgi:septal ring factor EnvC (AmiA/AmiB activator)
LAELERVISNQSDKISSLIGQIGRMEAEISDLRLAVATQAHAQTQAEAQAQAAISDLRLAVTTRAQAGKKKKIT